MNDMNLHDYTVELLKGDFLKECDECSKGNIKGRPANNKSLTWAQLMNVIVYDKVAVGLQRCIKTGSSQRNRPDAEFTSVNRVFKKIPDLLFKKLNTTAQLKASDTRKYLKAQVRAYLTGFCQIFNLDDSHPSKSSDALRMSAFLDYLMIYCSRALEIYTALANCDHPVSLPDRHSLADRIAMKVEWKRTRRLLTSKTECCRFYQKNV